MLEIASMLRESLSGGPLACRVQFAAHDMEEFGMLGSQVHARSLYELGVPVLGMICLEMLGFADHRPGSQRLPAFVADRFSNVANFIGVLANEDSRSLCEATLGGFRTVEALPVESLVVPGRGEWLPVVRRGDHSSFWDCGFPAAMITDTSFLRNPNYHKWSDTPETLDYEFLAKVTAGVVATVSRFCRPPEIR
jgi:Zn-dependent M28 family amino/carboxypeptidase